MPPCANSPCDPSQRLDLDLPLGLGICRAFLQVLGTSWGIKALSQGCALGKFNLLALKPFHFPLVMRMLSWVGSPAAVPHPPREGAELTGLCSSTSSCTAAHCTQGQSSTQGSTKTSLFPDGNDHPDDLEIQRKLCQQSYRVSKAEIKGPSGSGSAGPHRHL